MMNPAPTRCAFCKVKFTPEERAKKMRLHPSDECIAGHMNKLSAKKEAQRKKEQRARAKVERAMTKKRKEALRTFPQLEEDCRTIVQAIARIRDRDDGCISCDLPASWDGQWHGSHFRAHGSASAVQFHLWNIHKACWICNKLYSGRIDAYRPKLVAKIGQDRVDWLMSQNQTMKHAPAYRAYLMRFKQVMGKRLRRMKEKRA